MKLATFTTKGSEDPRYGFKKEEYIIDILYLSKFLHVCLFIPPKCGVAISVPFVS